MSAAKYDLTIPKGEDYSFTLRILDSLDVPFTFTVPYGKAEIREDDRKPLAAAFNIIAPLNPTDGTLKFALTSTQTLALDSNKRYKWDFFLNNGSAKTRLLYGNVDAIPNITHLTGTTETITIDTGYTAPNQIDLYTAPNGIDYYLQP
jgi:hypothetical protein